MSHVFNQIPNSVCLEYSEDGPETDLDTTELLREFARSLMTRWLMDDVSLCEVCISVCSTTSVNLFMYNNVPTYIHIYT